MSAILILVGICIIVCLLVAQAIHLKNVQIERLELIGQPKAPKPLLVKYSLDDAMRMFEEALVKRHKNDTDWVTQDYNLASGHFRTLTVTFDSGTKHIAPSRNAVTLDAYFSYVAETAETKINWSYSTQATVSLPDSRLDNVRSLLAINVANDRIRCQFGAPIHIATTKQDPAQGGGLSTE